LTLLAGPILSSVASDSNLRLIQPTHVFIFVERVTTDMVDIKEHTVTRPEEYLTFVEEPDRWFHINGMLHIRDNGWSVPEGIEVGGSIDRIIDQNGEEKTIILVNKVDSIASMVC